nr:hypothetical protein [Desulfobacterales bacterium]
MLNTYSGVSIGKVGGLAKHLCGCAYYSDISYVLLLNKNITMAYPVSLKAKMLRDFKEWVKIMETRLSSLFGYLSYTFLMLKKKGLAIFVFLIPLTILSFWPVGCECETVDRIVAIVNDDIITLSELNEAVELYLKQRPESYASVQGNEEILFKIRNEILNRLIDQKLAQQEVDKKGIKIQDDEVDSAIERIKNEYFLTDEEFKKILERSGIPFKEYREQTRKQLLRMKLINLEVKSKIVITEQEIRDYYEKHQDEYEGNTRYHLLGILFKVQLDNKSIEEENAIYGKVEKILQELKAGASFEDVIQRYSNGKIPIHGGDLGFFTLQELTPELKKVVQVMKEGEISPVLKTSQGYQVVKLQKVVATPERSLDDVRMQIHEKLFHLRKSINSRRNSVFKMHHT